MVLNISNALKAPGTSFQFSLTQDLEPMAVSGEEIVFRRAVEVTGKYMFSGASFQLEGSLAVSYKAPCSRCLKDVEAELLIPFDEEFAKEADDEHPDRYLYQGEQIVLDQIVGDLIALNIPMRHLCNEGCRGLCPVCGADRNTTDCRCHGADPEGETPYAAF